MQVVDGVTGAPVERFGVRLVPKTGAGVAFDSSRRLGAAGDHPGGCARVPEVLPGEYMLSVETADARFVPTAYRRLRIGTTRPEPVLVEVWPAAVVTCRVAAAAGVPRAGSRVELLVVSGGVEGEPPSGIRPDEMPYFGDSSRRYGTLLAEGTTDAAGTCVLGAPRGGPFAVRISGDHRTVYREGLQVEGDAEWSFAVASAASVVGRIQPWPLPARGEATLQHGAPVVTCASGAVVPPPGASPVAVDGEGHFRIDGIPAGAARLQLPLWIGAEQRSRLVDLEVELSGLRDGERREVVLDVAPFVPVELRLRVLLNGTPAAGAKLRLELVQPQPGPIPSSVFGPLDEAGRIALGVPPGIVRPLVLLDDGRLPCQLEDLVIDGRESTERVLQLCTGRVRVRLLRSDGRAPLAGVTLLPVGAPAYDFPPPTDGDGVLDLGPVRCGPLTLQLWPRHLAAAGARLRLVRDGGDPSAFLLTAGVVAVAPASKRASW